GKVSTDINSRPDFGKAITLQPDTKIILTGYSYAPSGIGEIVVARYENIILTTNEHQDIEFQLYPNPANEQITIEFGNYSTKYQVEILDILGRKVFHSEIQGMGVINTATLSLGTYLVKIHSENKATVVRFIKK